MPVDLLSKARPAGPQPRSLAEPATRTQTAPPELTKTPSTLNIVLLSCGSADYERRSVGLLLRVIWRPMHIAMQRQQLLTLRKRIEGTKAIRQVGVGSAQTTAQRVSEACRRRWSKRRRR
jgi:hypothetical protein